MPIMAMKPNNLADLTLLDAIEDKALFAPWFRKRFFQKDQTWESWLSFLRVLFGHELSEADIELFQKCTGRTDVPDGGFTEAFLVCGRRAGKSFIISLVAIYLACFHDWGQYLQLGERGTIAIMARDRAQCQTIFNYVAKLLHGVKVLTPMITRETNELIELSNGVNIEITVASFRSIRSRSIIAGLCDELAFWNDEGTNPDVEVLKAIRPGMGLIPGAMLLCASSPYARRGALWEAYRHDFGKNGTDVLIWKSPTRVMNPTFPQRTIDRAIEKDPADAAAEYMAEFRTDIESFIDRALVESLVVPGCIELAPSPGVRYVCYVDPASGSGADSMTLSIAHKDPSSGLLMTDAIREAKPPFSPRDVIAEFSMLLEQYGITRVVGDDWGKNFVRQSFEPIVYLSSDWTTAEIYLEILGRVNSRRVRFLDNKTFVTQFCNLERRTGRNGRDSVTHPNGEHDDVCNAVAGALLLADAPDARIKWCAVSASGEIYDGSTQHPIVYYPPPSPVETY
jgi:hypothetical protein